MRNTRANKRNEDVAALVKGSTEKPVKKAKVQINDTKKEVKNGKVAVKNAVKKGPSSSPKKGSKKIKAEVKPEQIEQSSDEEFDDENIEQSDEESDENDAEMFAESEDSEDIEDDDDDNGDVEDSPIAKKAMNKKVTLQTEDNDSSEGNDNEPSDNEPEEEHSDDESGVEVKVGEKRKKSDKPSDVDPKKQKTSEEKQELRKKKEELKKKRKEKDSKSYELSVNAKTIWETVRREDCSEEKRKPLLDKLLNMIKDHVKEIIRAHDTVRVIETIVSTGNEQHRTKLFNELKGDIVSLCKLKYAKFFVLKMLKYGTKEQTDFIIKKFYGNVKSLLNHTEASVVLESAYVEVANAKQRALLTQEYYSIDLTLFKDEKTINLKQVLDKCTTEEKDKLLEKMKDELIKLTSRNSIKFSITHFLLREYMKHAPPNGKHEVSECLRESVVEILHTKDGSRVAMECLWFGSAKERKVILKSFQKVAANIAKEDDGHLVILAAFDCVDDTKKLLEKFISELCSVKNAVNLSIDKNGVKIFEYLLSPRDSRFFHKDIIGILKRGDGNPYTKKDRGLRETELKEMAIPYLLRLVENNAAALLATGSSSLLLMNILTTEMDADRTDALKAVAKVVNEEGLYHSAKNDSNQHIIEKGSTHYVLKRLIMFDKKIFSLSKDTTFVGFSETLLEIVPSAILTSYVNCNKGCFMLLAMLETKIPNVVSKVTTSISQMNKPLKASNSKGAQLLAEALKLE